MCGRRVEYFVTCSLGAFAPVVVSTSSNIRRIRSERLFTTHRGTLTAQLAGRSTQQRTAPPELTGGLHWLGLRLGMKKDEFDQPV